MDAPLEGGWRLGSRQRGGDRAEAGPCAGLDHQHGRGAPDQRRAVEQRIARLGRGRRIRHWIDLLLDRIGFSRQQRFVDLRTVDRQRDAVGRHQVAGAELHHVASHDVGDRQVDRLAVAQDVGAQRDRALERLRRRFGAMLLDHVQAQFLWCSNHPTSKDCGGDKTATAQ